MESPVYIRMGRIVWEEDKMIKVVNKRHHTPTEHDEYIGRGPGGCHMMNTRPGAHGWLGNPVAIGRKCPECGEVHQDAGSTLPCYKRLLGKKIVGPGGWRQALATLYHEDLVLVCWCKPGPCHGDILAKAIRWAAQQL